jgi:hypothetical protein
MMFLLDTDHVSLDQRSHRHLVRTNHMFLLPKNSVGRGDTPSALLRQFQIVFHRHSLYRSTAAAYSTLT